MRQLYFFRLVGWVILVLVLASVESAISLPFISSWLVVRWLSDQSAMMQSIGGIVWGVLLSILTGTLGGAVALILIVSWWSKPYVHLHWFEKWRVGLMVILSLLPYWFVLGTPVSLILASHLFVALVLALLVSRRTSLKFLKQKVMKLGDA